jgi:hypothetical protein
MATNFPTSVDVLVNPTPTDSLNAPAHSTQHTNANDAIEAIEDYLLNGAGKTGLVLLKTQTIGTTVSSVTVTDAFSATYDNYLITINGGVASTAGALRLSLAGITSAGNYLSSGILVNNSTGATSTVINTGVGFTQAGFANTSNIMSRVELQNPFLTKMKVYMSDYSAMTFPGSSGRVVGYSDNAISVTEFTYTPASGTLTGGTICVYGYRK